MRESRARVRGARLRIGAILLGWQLAGSLLGVAAVWGFNRLCGLLLESAEVRRIVLVPLVTALLAGQALLVSTVSFLLVAVHCLLILRLYLERGGRPDPLLRGRGPAAWIERVGRGIEPGAMAVPPAPDGDRPGPRWDSSATWAGACRAGCGAGADRRRRPSGLCAPARPRTP